MTEETIPSDGKAFPTPLPATSSLGRLASFRSVYLAVFAFLLAYVLTVEGVEAMLDDRLRTRVLEAALVDPAQPTAVSRIQAEVEQALRTWEWGRLGGVRTTVILLAADGRTLFYARGTSVIAPILLRDPLDLDGDRSLFPVTADVSVAVPHNSLLAVSILLAYASLLLVTLFAYSRALGRREEQAIREAQTAREQAAHRAADIEQELDQVRQRLADVEPMTEGFADEVRSLEDERAELMQRLGRLEAREAELRVSHRRELEEERVALEQLLEEAQADLEDKDGQIRDLSRQVKQAGRGKAAATRSKERETELIDRRLRTLYKQLEVDDRAVSDLAALGDESLRLRAEEAMKRLSDEPDQAIVRRKVGGLPPHLSIFELGFAGKGRIYYTRGRQRRFRVLLIGAKNSQKPDLEYLSRLPRE